MDADSNTSSSHDDGVFIYHMCQKKRWQTAVASGERFYFPPTFDVDGGFVHATQHPEQLLDIANHFYQNPKDEEWICLQLRPSVLLNDFGIRTVWEAPAPVGATASFTSTDESTEATPVTLFPHVYGGIPTLPSSGVVTSIYPMLRNADGKFLSIPGFVE